MKEYKQPKTRIKRVKDGNGEMFYAQYKLVLIPFVLQGWENIIRQIGNPDAVPTLEEAKQRIDDFLKSNYRYWQQDQERLKRKKIKKEVEYIKYP